MSLHCLDVISIIPDSQKSTMHVGMQGLDATIHDFRKIGHIGNIRYRQSRVRDGLCRATRRQQLDAKFGQDSCQLDNVRLVRNGKKGCTDFDFIGSGDFFGNDSHRAYSV
ncbi:hypothetical protein D3C87_1303210 [compost metagenome]